MAINQTARAKVNLSLHVTGQRADGYHLLDGIVVFASVGDVLSAEPAEDFNLSIDGPFAQHLGPGESNLVTRAAALFGHVRGARIRLTKNLPVASGIGGGSADAAATCRALERLWEVAPLPFGALMSLGADVPVCYAQETARMRGIGDELTPLRQLPQLFAVLVNPGLGVSTPAVFKALTRKDNAPLSDIPPRFADMSTAIAWLAGQRNDLQQAAIALVPEIDAVLEALDSQGATLSRMSGSGATCFGLFSTDEQATVAAQNLTRAAPGWWVQATVLG